jgi:hypothetical protein
VQKASGCSASAHAAAPLSAHRYCTAPGAPPAAAGAFPAAQYRGSNRLKELNAILGREVMLRRLKDSVLRELPPKVGTAAC